MKRGKAQTRTIYSEKYFARAVQVMRAEAMRAAVTPSSRRSRNGSANASLTPKS